MKILKIAALVVTVLVFVFAVMGFFLEKVLLPQKLSRLVTEKAFALTGRRATLEQAEYSLFKGVTLRNLALLERDGTTPFLKAEEIRFQIILLPFFRKARILIPRLSVQNAELAVARNPYGILSVADILHYAKRGVSPNGASAAPWITAFSLDRMKISIRDDAVTPPQAHTLLIDKLSAHVSLPFSLSYSLNGTLQSGQPVPFSAAGSIQAGGRFSATLQLSGFNPETFAPYWIPQPLHFLQGLWDAKVRFTKGADEGWTLQLSAKSEQAEILYQGKRLKGALGAELSGRAAAPNVPLKFSGSLDLAGATFAGVPKPETTVSNLSGRLQADFDLGKSGIENWQAQGKIKEAALQGLEGVPGKLESVQATFRANPKEIQIADASFLLNEVPIQVSGTLKDPAHPFFDTLNLKGDAVDLGKLWPPLSQAFPAGRGVAMSGKGSFNLKLKGPAAEAALWEPAGTVRLDKAGIMSADKSIALQEVTGTASIEGGRISANDVSLLLNGVPLQASATVNDVLKNPAFDVLHIRGNAIDWAKLSPLIPKFAPKAAGLSIAGGGSLDLRLKGPLRQPALWDPSGTVRLSKSTVVIAQAESAIQDVTGTFTVEKDRIGTKDATLRFMESSWAIEGGVSHYLQAPQVDLLAKSDIDLGGLREFPWRKVRELLEDVALSGRAPTTVRVKGLLGAQNVLDFNCVTTVINGSFQKPPLFASPVEKIAGTLQVQGTAFFQKTWQMRPNRIVTQDLAFQWEGEPGSAEVTFLPGPPDSLNLLLKRGRDTLSVQGAHDRGILSLKQAEGVFKTNRFRFTGDVSDPFKDPAFNLYGDVQLNLESLPNVLTAQKSSLEPLNLRGLMNLNVLLKGRASNLKDAELGAKGTSAVVSVKGMRLNDVYVDFRMKDNRMVLENLQARPYGGTLAMQVVSFPKGTERGFEMSAEMLDVDLAELNRDFHLTEKNIYGQSSGALRLSGIFPNRSTYQGDGWLSIRNGYLWDIDIFNQLYSSIAGLFLNLPREIIFREGRGNFTVQNERITTRDFTLIAPEQMQLVFDGSLGFDQTLDFNVQTNFNEQFIQQAGTTRVGGFALSGAELLVSSKLKGTVKEPRVVTKLEPQKILQQKILPEILKGIFR